MQTVLITGASSGLGRAAAQHLASRGYRVFGTSRKPAAEELPYEMLHMDVTDEGSVARGVERVLSAAGRVDVLINNAGVGVAASIEDTTADEVRWVFETNVDGVLRLCRAVLPAMRAQGAGRIINVSSIGGVIGLPFQGLYSASKFAVEGLTEALRMEVRPYGIHVSLLEPGDFCTPFTANRRRGVDRDDGSPYAEALARSLEVIERDETTGYPPERIGPALEAIIIHPSPRLRYQVGAGSQKLATLAKRVLPAGLFERIIRSHYRVE